MVVSLKDVFMHDRKFRSHLGAIVVAITFAIGGVAASPVFADDVRAAADAFARGQQLSLDEKPGEAADFYELADELAPSPQALRNAARARFAAGHIAMAATNAAELLRRYPDDAASRSIAEMILTEVGPKVARIDVSCAGGCSVLLDGKATSRKTGDRHAFFAKPGTHEVRAVFPDGQKTSEKPTVLAGSRTTIELEPPPPLPVAEPAPDRATAPPRQGISRGWVIAGAVVTAGLGGAAVYEGLATLDDRDHIRELVAAGDHATAESELAKARDRQTLTNVLIGATAAAGVATITAAFFTRWSGGEESSTRLSVTPLGGGGAAVTLGGGF